MTDDDFLKTLASSFKAFLATGSRSNEKLKILHGAISADISAKLGANYSIQSLDSNNGKEASIQGRYINKDVDIAILSSSGNSIAGISVKFVMNNYSQNSNNYFENMLGETANIRCSSVPYFQIFILPEKMPYFKNGGTFKNWEVFSEHNAKKYLALSTDDSNIFLHTPNKTLLYVIKFPDIPNSQVISTKQDYIDFYTNYTNLNIVKSSNTYGTFNNGVIYNNYSDFINKVCHYILSI